jgi:L-ascorbate metabolism protein UlaG (beta-lactamase superfamily)
VDAGDGRNRPKFSFWRSFTDFAKHNPVALRAADFLGRGRGRLRPLDRFDQPTAPPHRIDLTDWETRELAVAWVGHATVLLRLGGMNILTDPVFSNRVGLDLGLFTAGPRRLVASAISIRDLPPLDLILLSHAHFDHLDRPSLNRLPKATPVITAHKTADLARDLGFADVAELNWGESIVKGALKATAIKVAHWGARVFYDQYRGYNAYLLEAAGRRVLFGGDTALTEAFKNIGPVDVAILGIGAYDPWVQSHATPEQAWEMANDAQAAHIMPMHYGTFRLSHEPMDEPIRRLIAAAGDQAGRIATREIGDVWSI